MRAIMVMGVVLLGLLGHAHAEGVAVVFVVHGSETMIGNDAIESDPNATVPGMMPALTRGFENLELAKILPPGSEAAVVAYDDKGYVRLPLADARKLSATDLGTQKDYYRRIGSSLLDGISVGQAELAKSHAARKMLIIIGDGNATNIEEAQLVFPRLRSEMLAAGVVPMAFIYKGMLSDPSNVVTLLDPSAQTLSSAESIAPAIAVRLASQVATVAKTAPPETSCISVYGKQFVIGLALLVLGFWIGRSTRA